MIYYEKEKILFTGIDFSEEEKEKVKGMGGKDFQRTFSFGRKILPYREQKKES